MAATMSSNRDAAELAQTLFEEIGDAVFIVDPVSERILEVNPLALRLTGLSRVELQRLHVEEVFRSEGLERFQGLRQALHSTQAFHSQEGFLLKRSPTDAWTAINLTLTRLHSDSGILGLILARDITERKRAEELLAVRQAELLHASRLSTVGQMVAALSHEVAQPLSAIRNFAAASAALLETDLADSTRQLQEYNQAILRQSERCRAILDRLRGFSMRSTNRRQRCNLNEELRSSVELTAADLRRHQIVAQLHLTEPLPPIWADPIQIQQVAINLVNNARDAVAGLPSERRVIAVRTWQDGGAVTLEVADRGVGLTEDVRRRLFEPFFTTKSTGMGIGLSICHSIVCEHSGRIEAHSASEGGAVFRVWLPICQESGHE